MKRKVGKVSFEDQLPHKLDLNSLHPLKWNRGNQTMTKRGANDGTILQCSNLLCSYAYQSVLMGFESLVLTV